MPHQVNIEELRDFRQETTLAVSAKDEKSLVVVVSIIGIMYAVKKAGLVRLFTNLPAAVKYYNE